MGNPVEGIQEVVLKAVANCELESCSQPIEEGEVWAIGLHTYSGYCHRECHDSLVVLNAVRKQTYTGSELVTLRYDLSEQ